ncbi:signal transduction histidine kinase [Murinocardiopsis flavida]|uniref:Signal transduction histidine kinase n=1 Tax=Murinocardiopsis flavida TaxID=645275 RepID=A0A2P8D8U8_9ACTN|nr:sensor histidine kinase [Murinocardiopsis flavida]PSK93632.1 signal transduction histidine kinase [Murinocardiopsis flavida]
MLWIGLSVAALSLVLAISLGIGGDHPPLRNGRAAPDPLWVVAPIVVLLVLRVCMELVYQRAHGGGRLATALYLVHGLTLLAGVALNPFLCIYAFLGFLDVERFLPRRVVAGGIIGAALLCAFGQAGAVAGVTTSPLVFIALLLVNVGLAGAMTWFAWLREEHADERERVAAELAEAHRENLALHEQLLEQARSAGVAQERARLSREIHDTVAQGLVGVIRQLEALPGALGENARPGIERAEHAARDCLSEARRAVRALAPHQLAEDDLTSALRGLVEHWTASQATPAELVVVGTPAAGDGDDVVLRVTQESLANVARHARASSVTVTLSWLPDTLLLDVADDGIGFDPNAMVRGRGLAGMRERLVEVGGQLIVESEPDHGTTIAAQVPR